MELPRPGCVLRSALVVFGLLFLPLSIWFAYADFHRNWINALCLFFVAVTFLRWGLSRNADSWISTIDDLDSNK